MDANTMFHKKHNELVTIHQSNGCLVCLNGFFDGTRTEVTSRYDQSLFVHAQATTNLLYYRSLNIAQSGTQVRAPSIDSGQHSHDRAGQSGDAHRVSAGA